MSSALTVDRREAGLWVLQDHAKVDMHDRMFLAGVRVIEPQGGDDEWSGHVYDDDSKGGNKGTAGDIHPWRFWSPGSRGHGLWTMALLTRVVASVESETDAKGRPITGGGGAWYSGVLPIRDAGYSPAPEFQVASHKTPKFWPVPAGGLVMLGMAGTREDGQENVLGWADPRILAVNKNADDQMGSMIVDTEAGGYASPLRVARAQTHFRVAHVPEYGDLKIKTGWAACFNLYLTGQGSQAGYGAMYGPVQKNPSKDKKPPTTPRDPDPPTKEPVVTPGDKPPSVSQAIQDLIDEIDRQIEESKQEQAQQGAPDTPSTGNTLRDLIEAIEAYEEVHGPGSWDAR